jgi:hypothetical protein
MPASHHFSAPARQWPFFIVALATGFGAMYCAAEYALAASLTRAQMIVSDPQALAHWQRTAALYGAGLVACLTFFIGSCVALRRRRRTALVNGRGAAT